MFARALTLLLLCLTMAGPALAQNRIALLVGNQDYKPGVGKLVNPRNDVRLVGDALRKVGFEIEKPVINATRAEILDALDRYATKVKDAGPDAIGFIYYSGHGMTSEGTNYLVPIDIERPSTRLLRAYGLRLREVLSLLSKEAPDAAHYLAIDAGRHQLQGPRDSKGLVGVNLQNGALISYAAAPGMTAADQGSGGSPYARALAREIVRPGVPDLIMFHRVRTAVIASTAGEQMPWTVDGIRREQRVKFGD